jgi:hypothetical protein
MSEARIISPLAPPTLSKYKRFIGSTVQGSTVKSGEEVKVHRFNGSGFNG